MDLERRWRRVLGSGAADVAQSALTIALESYGATRPAEEFRRISFGIARRLAASELRRRDGFQLLGEEFWKVAEQPRPRADHGRLAELLAAMTKPQRAVAVLLCRGCSVKEVAFRQGVTERAVRSVRQRIRALARSLGFLGQDVPPRECTRAAGGM